MRRRWFRAEDGTYYRNIPLINADLASPINRCLPWRLRALDAEWSRAFSKGSIRASKVRWWDKIETSAPFREAYPDRPGLWVLDQDEELKP